VVVVDGAVVVSGGAVVAVSSAVAVSAASVSGPSEVVDSPPPPQADVRMARRRIAKRRCMTAA
jgi:hypothetical protein